MPSKKLSDFFMTTVMTVPSSEWNPSLQGHPRITYNILRYLGKLEFNNKPFSVKDVKVEVKLGSVLSISENSFSFSFTNNYFTV